MVTVVVGSNPTDSIKGDEITMYKITEIGTDWHFSRDKTCYPKPFLYDCEYCGRANLISIYVDIIDNLKKNNLLPENYKKICCYCNLVIKIRESLECPFCGWHVLRVKNLYGDRRCDLIVFCLKCNREICYKLSDKYYTLKKEK